MKKSQKNEKWPEYEEWPEGLSEQIKEKGIFFQIIRVLLGLGVIASLIYLSGLHQYFFFHKTPSQVEQPKLQKKVDGEKIFLPVEVYVLSNESNMGSERSKQNVMTLVKKTSNVWEQAAINFEIREIHLLQKSDREINTLIEKPSLFIKNLDQFNSELINIILIEKLGGLNGLSFPGLKTAVVADYTTESDFRVLAHEIGHILELGHAEKKSKLMSQGANGMDLSLKEITKARKKAEKIIDQANE